MAKVPNCHAADEMACAVIVARAGSKGLPRKNIAKLGGTPLLVRAIDACEEAHHWVGKVIVTSDDDEFLDIARRYGARTVIRPPRMASDVGRIDESAQHAVAQVFPHKPPVMTLIIQPNCPIWEPGTIAAICERMHQRDCTAVVTVRKVRERPEWMMQDGGEGYLQPWLMTERAQPVNRQELAQNIYHVDGQVVCVETKRLLGEFPRTYLGACGARIAYHLHDEVYSTDIDTPKDLVTAEALCAWLSERNET
jgi:CMP-N-acetylneuraminic acid synthetase